MCEADSEQTFRDLGFDFRPTTRTADYVASAPLPIDRDTKRQWLTGTVRAYYADEVASASYDVALADPLEPGADYAAEAAGVPWVSYAHFAMDEVGPDVWFGFHLWDRTSPPEQAFVVWWTGLREAVGLPPDPRPYSEHLWLRQPTVVINSRSRVGRSLPEPPSPSTQGRRPPPLSALRRCDS